MKVEITLKINGQKVDIINSEEFAQQFAITYSFSDLYEPDKITDTYSKSITLPGTPNNNKIFGHIWKFDSDNIEQFNPSQLSDFQIFLNNELWQTGTAQLTEIVRKDNVYSYKVTLYGQVTKIMSILMNSDIEDENNKLLRSLNYPTKLTHTLTPDMITRMWSGSNYTGYIYLNDYMQYIPCQNGLYDNFSSSKALHYISGTWKVGPVIQGINNGSGGLEFDEYTHNEYRVEYQRPAVKMNKLIEQIVEDASTDASINLDSDFFNNDNPYWNNTYLTLSQYTTESDEGNISADWTPTVMYKYVPNDETSLSYDLSFKQTDGQFQLYAPDSSTVIYYGNISGRKTISLEFKVRVHVMASTPISSNSYLLNGTWGGNIGDEMTISTNLEQTRWPVSVVGYMGGMSSAGKNGAKLLWDWCRTDIGNWGRMGTFGSSLIDFTRSGADGYIYNNNYSNTYRYGYPIRFNEMKMYSSYFPVTVDTNYERKTFKFTVDASELTDTGTIRLNIDYINHNFSRWELTPIGGGSSRYFLRERLELPILFEITPITYNNEWPTESAGYTGIPVSSNYDTAIRSGDNFNGQYSGMSPSRVATTDMFDTTTTQGKVLLDYTKLLGLLYDVDNKGNISILSRNKYFSDYKIEDWSDKIDYSKELKFKPLTFDSRYFEMKYNPGDTYYENKYTNEFGLDYGEKKINTGYAFNFDTKQFLESTIFTNTVISSDIRREYYGVDSSGNLQYWEMTPVQMPALFQKDGETKSSADLKYNLLFCKHLRSGSTAESAYVSCDSSIMMNKNVGGGEYCWWDVIDSGVDTTVSHCVYQSKLPVFSTHYDDYSWDIGLPRISYDGTTSAEYSSASTVYSRYWENYIAEIYNVKNKILTCYVKLSWIDILNFSFKNFVIINGVLYHPNKLLNVNPLSDDPIQVEFIQVQNIDAYTSGQRIPGSVLRSTPRALTASISRIEVDDE